MRIMVQYMQPLVFLPILFVIALRQVEIKLIHRFLDSNATLQGSAIKLDGLNAIYRWQLGRLVRAGAVVAVPGQAFYLNYQAYSQYRKSKKMRALTAVTIALVVVFILLAFRYFLKISI